MYACPLMPSAPCPPECPPSKPEHDSAAKYYREIGAAAIGNHLIIRMERKKGKSRKLKDWDPPCDCDVVEIQRPTSTQGPKILRGPDNNRILFHVEPRRRDDEDAMAQAISYEVGQCRGGPNTNDQCRTFTIYPVVNGSDVQEVHTDRVTEGNEDVFMLKVKRKSEYPDQPRRNVELELRMPTLPTPVSEQPEVEPPLHRKIDFMQEEDCTQGKETKGAKKLKKKKKKRNK